jgi:hypothetical protein
VMGSAFSAPRDRIFISYCLLWLGYSSSTCLSKTNVTFQ